MCVHVRVGRLLPVYVWSWWYFEKRKRYFPPLLDCTPMWTMHPLCPASRKCTMNWWCTFAASSDTTINHVKIMGASILLCRASCMGWRAGVVQVLRSLSWSTKHTRRRRMLLPRCAWRHERNIIHIPPKKIFIQTNKIP